MYAHNAGRGQLSSERRHSDNYVTMIIAGVSVLTLLVGRQEGHPVRKNMGEWWRWALVSLDGVAPKPDGQCAFIY